MPVPVIDDKTSVLAFSEGHPYHVQFSATETPTSWAITDGEVPSGMTLDTATGILDGTPDLEAAGSVYKIHLTATNGSGASAELVVVMGVERAYFEIGAAVPMEISLGTGVVTLPNVKSVDPESGLVVMHAKSGDVFPISVSYTKGGRAQDISADSFLVSAKEFSDETEITLSNGVWHQSGSGSDSHYRIILDLSQASLDTLLSDHEGDDDTVVDLRVEVSMNYFQDVGTGTPLDAIRTSRSFILRLHREIG